MPKRTGKPQDEDVFLNKDKVKDLKIFFFFLLHFHLIATRKPPNRGDRNLETGSFIFLYLRETLKKS